MLATIFLIAGSTLAGVAPFANGVATTSGETVLMGDFSPLASPSILYEAAASTVDGHDCNQNSCIPDCRADCIGSAVSGCCAAAISLAGCHAFNPGSIPACGITGTGFVLTGIDPEALLRPPQSHV